MQPDLYLTDAKMSSILPKLVPILPKTEKNERRKINVFVPFCEWNKTEAIPERERKKEHTKAEESSGSVVETSNVRQRWAHDPRSSKRKKKKILYCNQNCLHEHCMASGIAESGSMSFVHTKFPFN